MQNTTTIRILDIPHKAKSKPALSASPLPPSNCTASSDAQSLEYHGLLFPIPPSTIPSVSSVKTYRRRGREIGSEELVSLMHSIKVVEEHGSSSCNVPQTEAGALPCKVQDVLQHTESVASEEAPPVCNPLSDSDLAVETITKVPTAPVKCFPLEKTTGFTQPQNTSGCMSIADSLPPQVDKAFEGSMERSASEGSGKSNHSTILTIPREEFKGVQFEELPHPPVSSSRPRADVHVPGHGTVKKDTSDSISISSKMSRMSAREKLQASGRSIARSIKASLASLRSTTSSQSSQSMSTAESSSICTISDGAETHGRKRAESHPIPPQFMTLPPFTRHDGEFDFEAQFAYGRPKPLNLDFHLPKLLSSFRRDKPKKGPEIIYLEHDEMTHAVVTLNPYRLEFVLPKSIREQVEEEARKPPPKGLVKTMKQEFLGIRQDVNRFLRSREHLLPPELGGQDGGIQYAQEMKKQEVKEARATPGVTVSTNPDGEDRSTLRRKRAQYFRRSASSPNLRAQISLTSTIGSKKGLRQELGWAGVPRPIPRWELDPENCTLVDIIESAIEAYLEQAESLDQPLVLPLIRPLMIPGKNAPKHPIRDSGVMVYGSKGESVALVISGEALIEAADAALKRQSIRGSIFFDLNLDFGELEQEPAVSFVEIGTREEASRYLEYKAHSTRPIDELNDEELEWIFLRRTR